MPLAEATKNCTIWKLRYFWAVYEASFILDPFFPNKSDIKPHIVYGDTHAQSLTVFGLAHLLGIQLMPRIARWKDLKIYKFPGESYPRIDPKNT